MSASWMRLMFVSPITSCAECTPNPTAHFLDPTTSLMRPQRPLKQPSQCNSIGGFLNHLYLTRFTFRRKSWDVSMSWVSSWLSETGRISGCRCWSLCWLLGWHPRFGWVWSLGGLLGELGFTTADLNTIGFPKKPPVGKHLGKMRWDEFQNKWIIRDGEFHIRGHKHVFFQTMWFWMFLIYIPRSLCWCPWIANGLSNLWDSFLNSAMCRDSTVSQIRGPSQMSPFPASRVTDFSWNPIFLKPPFRN